MKTNNIQNGGLICQIDDKVVIGNKVKGTGMYWLQDNKYQELKEIMPWFMNADEAYIYYSDEMKDRYLCRMAIGDRVEVTLIKEPVYLLQRHKNDFFYINEKNRQLYCYGIEDRAVHSIIDQEISNFVITQEGICYSNERGIFMTSFNGRENEKISKHQAIRLICDENYLVFADKEQEYILSYINLQSGDIKTIEGSMTSSILARDGQIFYSNAKENSHIYRYSIESDLQFKVVPERADYLHLIDNNLYYLSKDKKIWMKVPVQGGKATPVIESF